MELRFQYTLLFLTILLHLGTHISAQWTTSKREYGKRHLTLAPGRYWADAYDVQQAMLYQNAKHCLHYSIWWPEDKNSNHADKAWEHREWEGKVNVYVMTNANFVEFESNNGLLRDYKWKYMEQASILECCKGWGRDGKEEIFFNELPTTRIWLVVHYPRFRVFKYENATTPDALSGSNAQKGVKDYVEMVQRTNPSIYYEWGCKSTLEVFAPALCCLCCVSSCLLCCILRCKKKRALKQEALMAQNKTAPTLDARHSQAIKMTS